jgi:Phage integrase, N-terminal SAM-like domain
MVDALLPAIRKQPGRPASAGGALVIPAVIADAGDHAAKRFLEFFAATIRNKNTRMAYYRATCHFFAWVEQHEIGGLADIEPVHVAAYIEVLQTTAAKPTVKLHLAAIRMSFDWLVVGQVLAVNPARTRCAGPSTSCAVARRPSSPKRKPGACLTASTLRLLSACVIAR